MITREPTSEQDALAAAVRGFLAGRVPPECLRSAAGTPAPWPVDSWRRLAGELGVVGLAVPEACGGGGGTVLDLAVALEEAGRVLLPAPLLSTAVAATLLAGWPAGSPTGALARAPGAPPASRPGADGPATTVVGDRTVQGSGEVVGRLLAGTATAAVAVDDPAAVRVEDGRLTGVLAQVVDGAAAGVLLVAAGPALYLVGSGFVAEPLATLDQSRPQARVRLAGAAGVRLAATTAQAQDLLAVAVAAEAVGSARACLERTVEHLRTRMQFGRPLGSFQALRHRVADLTVTVEAAAATARHAAWAAAAAPGELPVAAPLARAVCVEAFAAVAAEAIQLHGGIGVTWEHDAHLYLKRAAATRLLVPPRALRRLAYSRAHPP